ncbi:MAG: cation:proton antiporter, partial [Anaerolineales bacterium]|nr:cation:proton antiporter [Anaerolineales bacterium]
LSWPESWQLGTGMVSRGEVGLIVASVGMQAGLTTDATFAAILGMVITSTLITPPMLRYLFNRPERKKTTPALQDPAPVNAQRHKEESE